MLWQEKTDSGKFIVADDVMDLSFRIQCSELPVDHAWALSQAIQAELPWIRHESDFAIHSLYGAASGNGWNRPPPQSNSRLQLSRRTRLYLRLAKQRVADAMTLTGATLELSGCVVKVGECRTRALVPARTVFSRSVCGHAGEDEAAFSRRIAHTLRTRDITVTKMLCGLAHTIHTPPGNHTVRSVLIADLDPDQSMQLQRRGVGPGGKLGCGIFLPHKGLAAVAESQGHG